MSAEIFRIYKATIKFEDFLKSAKILIGRIIKKEMLHILTIVVREITHACIHILKWLDINVQHQNYLSKRITFGYYVRFSSRSFLDEKPPDLNFTS